MKTINDVKKLLKLNQLRITQSRIAIAKILIKNKNIFLTSDEIYDKVCKSKNFNCDRVSVYRILNKFVDIELVIKSNFHGEASKYCLDYKESNNGHKHFFKCTYCKTIEEFQDCLVVKKEKELEKQGYNNLSHHLEIKGLCPNCSP